MCGAHIRGPLRLRHCAIPAEGPALPGGRAASALRAEAEPAGAERVDEAPANEAGREAIVNAPTNANWFDRRGIVCVWRNEAITIENHGDFRMPLEEAREPVKSDPRNETTMKIFAMVEIGERTGNGMDKIFNGWAWPVVRSKAARWNTGRTARRSRCR